MFKARDQIKHAAIKDQSEVLMSAYKQLRNKVIKLSKKGKREYFMNKIQASDGNLEETWATINKLVAKRSKTANLSSLSVDGNIITDSVGITNSLSEFFL